MLKLEKLKLRFEFENNEHELNELSIGQLEEIQEEVKTNGLTEVSMYCMILKKAGLSDKVAKSLTLRQLKQLTEELAKEKKM